MQPVYANKIAVISHTLAAIEPIVANEWSPEDRAAYKRMLQQSAKECDFLALPMTKKSFDRAVSVLDKEPPDSQHFAAEIKETGKRFLDELGLNYFFQLSSRESELFNQRAPLFGQQVAEKFPGLEYDISEVGKCMALGRSTATAFHALRCLEGGFAAIWRSLAISDPLKGYERNWSNRLKRVEDAVEQKWPKTGGRGSPDAKFYDEATGALRGMQNPYRNATMHLDQIYTEDDARHVVELVRGFIQKVAARMDENGRKNKKPKA